MEPGNWSTTAWSILNFSGGNWMRSTGRCPAGCRRMGISTSSPLIRRTFSGMRTWARMKSSHLSGSRGGQGVGSTKNSITPQW
eukprot:7136900-Pyramimonas_sp.AAC.1